MHGGEPGGGELVCDSLVGGRWKVGNLGGRGTVGMVRLWRGGRGDWIKIAGHGKAVLKYGMTMPDFY